MLGLLLVSRAQAEQVEAGPVEAFHEGLGF